jgi:DNA-binding transcriptional regulator YiaG
MTPAEVKTCRNELGLTQAQLADRLGITRNTVARWEMGMHPVSAPIELLLKTLAAAAPPHLARKRR